MAEYQNSEFNFDALLNVYDIIDGARRYINAAYGSAHDHRPRTNALGAQRFPCRFLCARLDFFFCNIISFWHPIRTAPHRRLYTGSKDNSGGNPQGESNLATAQPTERMRAATEMSKQGFFPQSNSHRRGVPVLKPYPKTCLGGVRVCIIQR